MHLYRLWCRNAYIQKFAASGKSTTNRSVFGIQLQNEIKFQMKWEQKEKRRQRFAISGIRNTKTENKHQITNADKSKSRIPIINIHLRSEHSKHIRGSK